MKVYIGPYIHRWTTTNFEHWYISKRFNDEYWNVDESQYNKFDAFVIDKFCNWWQTILNYTINAYIDRKKENVNIRIDNYDTWNLDYTLALIILPALKRLKENKHGSPNVDDEDVPEELKSTPTENEFDVDKNHHKRWDWVIDEMIWSFEQKVNSDWESQFHTGNIDIKWTPIDDDNNEIGEEEKPKFYRMDKGTNDTHIFDREGYEAYQSRITNGFRLFGKYYEGLWD